jgi:hemerythrin-like metal-binding protein
MQLIVWTNDMSVNVKLLDNDHRKLALLINTLHHGLVTGHAKPELEEVFKGLVKHTLVHHAHEDKLMAETAYPGTEEHTLEHDSSVKRLLVLQMRFNNSDGLADELDVMNQLNPEVRQKVCPVFQSPGRRSASGFVETVRRGSPATIGDGYCRWTNSGAGIDLVCGELKFPFCLRESVPVCRMSQPAKPVGVSIKSDRCRLKS